MLDGLKGKMSTALLKMAWDQICANMRETGAQMIEDPDKLVKMLRGLADSIEKRKGFFSGIQGAKQNDQT